MTHKTVRIGGLTRVEGEGGLVVHARDGRITGLELRIYEPPRFFEALLRGRGHTEPPTSPRGSVASVPWRTR